MAEDNSKKRLHAKIRLLITFKICPVGMLSLDPIDGLDALLPFDKVKRIYANFAIRGRRKEKEGNKT
jgi:hypothetical protein